MSRELRLRIVSGIVLAIGRDYSDVSPLDGVIVASGAHSLTVAVDAFTGHRLGTLPVWLASIGVLALFAASLLLARESTLAVTAINEEMDHRPKRKEPSSS